MGIIFSATWVGVLATIGVSLLIYKLTGSKWVALVVLVVFLAIRYTPFIGPAEKSEPPETSGLSPIVRPA